MESRNRCAHISGQRIPHSNSPSLLESRNTPDLDLLQVIENAPNSTVIVLVTFTIKNVLLKSIPKFLVLTSYYFLSSPVHNKSNKSKLFFLSE